MGDLSSTEKQSCIINQPIAVAPILRKPNNFGLWCLLLTGHPMFSLAVTMKMRRYSQTFF